jgi:hypothetical protein
MRWAATFECGFHSQKSCARTTIPPDRYQSQIIRLLQTRSLLCTNIGKLWQKSESMRHAEGKGHPTAEPGDDGE